MARSIAAPENQPVSFVELFFDLIFVFSVTQVVGLLHDHVTALVLLQALIVFFLVWWAWTQFTWTLNAADTTNHQIELGTLAATAVAFIMAVSLPEAFGARALLFGVTYVSVRAFGLALYYWVTSGNPSQQAAVRRFTVASIAGMVAVLAGAAVGGNAQIALWLLAIVLDVIAAAIGGQAADWNIAAAHFTERHGLFVIIALGETLIVAASGVTGADWTVQLIVIGILAVATTCALWWSYFAQSYDRLEHYLAATPNAARAQVARDVFSLLHFPMLCGVVLYAVAIEQMVSHPDDPLSLTGRLALAFGLLLFVGGTGGALWRAGRQVRRARAVLIVATAVAVAVLRDVAPALTLLLALVGVLAIVVTEERTIQT